MSTSTEAPFSRPLALRAATVDRAGFDARASAAEAAAVARLFEAGRVEGLEITGSLSLAGALFRLEGRARATVEQACVVTGEPVSTSLDVTFDRYVAVGPVPTSAEVDVDPDERDIDHVEEPVVDLGAIAVEELALALPAYPRAADADALLDDLEADPRDDSPFAVLARRRGAS